MTWSSIAGVVAAVLLAAWLLRRYVRERARAREASSRFYARSLDLLRDARLEGTGSVGYPRLAGLYRDIPVQVLPVVDTLAVRRLPTLWLLVTVQDALPIASRLDLMMRPAGPTTFSNFDLLPHTLDRPPGCPEHGVLRSDAAISPIPLALLAPHLDIFEDRRAKELLITPTGLRLVWMLAEADRARYGVFRQAEFGDVDLDPALLKELLDRLLALRASLVSSLQATS